MSLRLSDWPLQARRLAAEMWSGGRGPVLVAVAGGWFLSLGVRMMYPAILPQLRADYGIDMTTAGLLITALWTAYALGQLPGGVLDDRLDGGQVLVISTLVSGVSLAAVVVAGPLAVVFAATVLFGFATALYGVARFTILSRIYPGRDGTAIGLTMAAGDLGNSLLPPLAGFLAVAVAWQAGLGVAVPVFLLATVALWVVLPGGGSGSDPGSARSTDDEALDTDGGTDPGSAADSGGTSAGDSDPGTSDASGDGSDGFVSALRTAATAMRRRHVLLVVGIQTLGYCIWQSFTAFYPTYLVEMKGIEPTVATAIFGGFFALGILVKPITGTIYDGYGLRRSLPVVLVAITAAMFLLPLAEGLPAILAVTALASAVLGYGTITLTFLTDSLPEAVRGTGLGSLRTGYMLVGAGSPTVVGALADAGFFDEAFYLLGGVAAVTVVLCLLVPRDATPTNGGGPTA